MNQMADGGQQLLASVGSDRVCQYTMSFCQSNQLFTNTYLHLNRHANFIMKYRDPLLNLFAQVSVYELPAAGGIELLQAYSESDVRDIMTLSNDDDKALVVFMIQIHYLGNCIQEEFYTCAWGYDVGTCDPLLAAAGRKGIIRLIRSAFIILLFMFQPDPFLQRPTKFESHAVGVYRVCSFQQFLLHDMSSGADWSRGGNQRAQISSNPTRAAALR